MTIQQKIRILFILPSLHAGGSETVMIRLLNSFDRVKFDISLIVLKKEGVLLSLVPRDITTIYLNHSRTIFSFLSIIKLSWRRRPQILFSTLGHVNLLMALLRPLLPTCFLVARESSIVSIRNKDERYPKIFDFLFKTVYKRFNLLVCQSKFMQEDLVKNFGVDVNKTIVINNPIDFDKIPAILYDKQNSPTSLLSVGQLRREKGYDRLIRALSNCNLDFSYKIIGGGNKESLEKLVNELNLSSKIKFLGQITHPFEILCRADCLLLGSYYEGLPNVVLEANACGVPVIAFRAPGGHNEIIQHGINGWFANDEQEFCELLNAQVYNCVDKDSIATMTRERYALPIIVKQYEDILITKYNLWCNGKGIAC